jgi:PTH2 family peptidyl-tRNA hydrolase
MIDFLRISGIASKMLFYALGILLIYWLLLKITGRSPTSDRIITIVLPFVLTAMAGIGLVIFRMMGSFANCAVNSGSLQSMLALNLSASTPSLTDRQSFYTSLREFFVMAEYKQVILVRHDLKLTKGKMAAQVSHASVESLLKSHVDDRDAWRAQGMKKVVLKVKDLKELLECRRKAEDAGLVVALITDAGRTQLEPGTTTCLGIGPDKAEKIDKVTGNLQLIS